MIYSVIFFVLLVVELTYFKVADRFNIIDKPNDRSSHTEVTIRGGGIIFYVSILLFFLLNNFAYPYFFIGLTIATALSFLDDIFTLSSKVRLPIQFISVGLMLFQALGVHWALLAFGLIVATGILNAYNFMDGINGITGLYSLVVLSGLCYINYKSEFIEQEFLYYSILGVLVFLFFNFRKKARCFAGDVGSVSIAMIVMFAIFKIITFSGNYIYMLFLSVYGVDSILTILHRLSKKENIFQAHRSHLYQWLVKPGPFSHLQMASIYGLLQLVIIFIVIQVVQTSMCVQLIVSLGIILTLSLVYVLIKYRYIKKYDLV